MSLFPSGRSFAPWSFLALLTAVAAATPARAQNEKTTVVTFASANASQNGFVHGQVKLRYRFDGCGGVPQLIFAMEQGSAQGYEGYWYEGKMYGLKSTWRAPDRPAIDAEMRVRFNAQPIAVAPLNNPYPGPISCMSGAQFRQLGKWSEFKSGTMTEEQALGRFDFDVGMTRQPMRSADVESAIRAEIAAATQKARADSLEKARLARVEQARKDSVARAQQQKATAGTPTTGATTGGASVPVTTGNAVPTQSAGQNAGQTEAELRAEEQRNADARARAVIAQLEAEQAAREERSRQVEQATQQVAGMVGDILAERAAEKERKREQLLAARERHEDYVDRVEKVFAALPARPQCTTRDTLHALAIGNEISGLMIGSECRLADSSSAHVYPLHIARKQKVEISATGRFETQLKVATSGVANRTNVLSSPDTGLYTESMVEGFLEPGDYAIIVQTRHPGESGTYALKVERGEISSTAKWSLGMYLNTVSGEFPGTLEESQFENMGGFRGMAAINKALHLQAAWGSADGTNSFSYWDVGARLYLGNRAQRFRPLFDVLYGGREMFADNGYTGTFYKGTGMTYAGGVEWFLSPKIGIELIYAQVGGELAIVEPRPGYSDTIDFTHGALRMGMMFHR